MIYSQLAVVGILNFRQGIDIIKLARSENIHEYRTPEADTNLNDGKSNYSKYGPFSLSTAPAENDGNGKGSSSVTVYDPYSSAVFKDENGDELISMHPLVVLSHETKHNSDKNEGIIDRRLNADGTQKISEDRAIATENITAKMIGEPEREFHNIKLEKIEEMLL